MRLRYGDADRRQLIEYVHGKADVEWAIAHLVESVPSQATRIVHLGCGIGWLTHELKRHRPAASIVGLDPSPSSIRVAAALFGEEGLEFEVGDPAAASVGQPRADVLVVSESEDLGEERSRDGLVRAIIANAGPDATVILHLRGSVPAAARDDLLAGVAQSVDGRITRRFAAARDEATEGFAILERSLVPGGPAANSQPPVLEHPSQRAERVAARLAVRVTRDGYLLPNGDGPAVLIVAPIRNAPSETFIKAQIEGLPNRVETLWGGDISLLEDEAGRRITPRWARALRRPLGMLGPRWPARVDRFFLYRFLDRRRVGLVVAIYGPTGVSMRRICGRQSIPLVTEFMGFDASERAVVESLEPEYRRLLADEAATIAVSRDIERRLVALGAPPERVHWIPCGVDVERFTATDAARNPPIFLAAGRFVDKKAPHLTLQAFSRLVADVPEARLRMVGGGPLLDACRQLAVALNVEGSVEFLGFRTHDELAALMGQARAFVQHSVVAPSGDSEGTPVAILEAGAAGLPVVATRHGGIIDSVIDGETGFLVDEGDVSAMADRMRRLADDPALAGRLGTRAREHIRERFDLGDTLARLWAVIQPAMAAGSPR